MQDMNKSTTSSFNRAVLLRIAPTLASLCIAASAYAEVSEALNYVHYDAPITPKQSLLAALNSASSIRQDGRTYHGYTKWDVRWNFWWNENRGRSCRITRVKVSVTSTITLPRLIGGTAAQKEEFERFSASLKTHELGHHAIGKEAAEEVENAIKTLPEMGDCKQLERAANAAGGKVIREHQEKEKRYDAETRHGKNQGAWLER
jgi:predicted secreted Zn-dependent protease